MPGFSTFSFPLFEGNTSIGIINASNNYGMRRKFSENLTQPCIGLICKNQPIFFWQALLEFVKIVIS
jgi:hypothetical protein